MSILLLVQSYGGFCAVTYLSFAPQGLKSVLLTGGIPPVGKGCTADSVYRACFDQVVHQNEKYYKRFPQDIEVVREVVNYLTKAEGGGVRLILIYLPMYLLIHDCTIYSIILFEQVCLPSGGILTPKGLQSLGLVALGSGGGFERLHYM